MAPDGCKAGGRIEIEHEVGKGGDLCDGHDAGDFGARALQHGKLFGVNQVFKPGKATARVPTTFSFAIKPVTAAAASCQETTPTMGTRSQAKGAAMRRGWRNRRCRHAKAPVEGLHNLNRRIAQKDDGGGLHNVSPATAAHGLEGTPERRDLVFGQLDDKEGLSVFVAGDLVDQQGAKENQNDTGQIHGGADPAGVVKEGAGQRAR